MIINFLLVAIGGFFGSIARFAISVKMEKHLIGTWIANISGSILLAFTFHFYLVNQLSQALWLFIGIGFDGAYTTFSTFSHESISLLLEKRYLKFIIYLFASFGITFFSVALII